MDGIQLILLQKILTIKLINKIIKVSANRAIFRLADTFILCLNIA